ncbi:MAG TPA: hypothetical protein ENH26_02180 [Candidatus Wolfebacteria bacterium]|nr:hypothetical protein [Candidatus Wolfebacteria bacterium]
MHSIQEKLIKLINSKNIDNLTLRQIGELIGENLPQKIKHHLSQLECKGFILIDKKNKKISRINNQRGIGELFVSIPIVGSANCGPANIYADENITGHLKVSKKLVPRGKKLFILRAEGNSMNKANIKNGKSIEDGDFVIVDADQISPESGQYVVSVIDGMANIKKFILDRENKRVILKSESTQDYLPIFIHEDDQYKVSGRVIDVIKK